MAVVKLDYLLCARGYMVRPTASGPSKGPVERVPLARAAARAGVERRSHVL